MKKTWLTFKQCSFPVCPLIDLFNKQLSNSIHTTTSRRLWNVETARFLIISTCCCC